MRPWLCSNDHPREAGGTSVTHIANAHRTTIARPTKLPTFLLYSTVPVAKSAAVSLNLGLIFQRGHPQRSCASVRLVNVDPPYRGRSVRSCVYSSVQVVQAHLQSRLVLPPRHPVHPRSRFTLQRVVGHPQCFRRDVVQQRSEFLLRFSPYELPYPLGRLCRGCPTLRPARALALRIPVRSTRARSSLGKGESVK